jgi:hypothetical protein
MHSNRINTLTTSQDQSAYCWHHTKCEHGASLQGTGYAVAHVKLPKNRGHVGGFPVDYHVSVTSSLAGVAVSVDVFFTPINGDSLPAGHFSVLVIG